MILIYRGIWVTSTSQEELLVSNTIDSCTPGRSMSTFVLNIVPDGDISQLNAEYVQATVKFGFKCRGWNKFKFTLKRPTSIIH